MPKRMLIDASHPEETRVVVLDGNRVEEFDFEAASKRPLKGNIYLAKVTRVEPSLQAAFVEYGGNRQGFLAFSEIHPDYYQIPVADRQALIEAQARRLMAEDEFDRVETGTAPSQETVVKQPGTTRHGEHMGSNHGAFEADHPTRPTKANRNTTAITATSPIMTTRRLRTSSPVGTTMAGLREPLEASEGEPETAPPAAEGASRARGGKHRRAPTADARDTRTDRRPPVRAAASTRFKR